VFREFYGLKDQPFGVTPDPRYLYLCPGHRESLASLFCGIEANRGFLALIAKPGMGKTTLLFQLLGKMRTTARTAFLFQTQCSSREFMRFLMAEFGQDSRDQDFVHMHEEFNRCLLQEARAGRRCVVVIDEAQNLDSSVLETVRLLSDFETPQAKLVQIILAGQPELGVKLASPQLVQLRQRISIVNTLNPLSIEETSQFIDHRLRVAGAKGQSPFSREAKVLIAKVSEGIPRKINNYCFNALSLGCAMRQKTIDARIVREVDEDLDIKRMLGGLNPDDEAPDMGGAAVLFGGAAESAPTISPATARDYMRQVATLLRMPTGTSPE
jgi:general secretion pathway protein A